MFKYHPSAENVSYQYGFDYLPLTFLSVCLSMCVCMCRLHSARVLLPWFNTAPWKIVFVLQPKDRRGCRKMAAPCSDLGDLELLSTFGHLDSDCFDHTYGKINHRFIVRLILHRREGNIVIFAVLPNNKELASSHVFFLFQATAVQIFAFIAVAVCNSFPVKLRCRSPA